MLYEVITPVLNMPLDYSRPDKRSFKGDSVSFAIQPKLVEAVNELSQKSNVTLNTLLVCSYAILLSRYCSQNEMVIGSLTAGRRHPDVNNMMGMFNNFLPLSRITSYNVCYTKLLRSVLSCCCTAHRCVQRRSVHHAPEC